MVLSSLPSFPLIRVYFDLSSIQMWPWSSCDFAIYGFLFVCLRIKWTKMLWQIVDEMRWKQGTEKEADGGMCTMLLSFSRCPSALAGTSNIHLELDIGPVYPPPPAPHAPQPNPYNYIEIIQTHKMKWLETTHSMYNILDYQCLCLHNM